MSSLNAVNKNSSQSRSRPTSGRISFKIPVSLWEEICQAFPVERVAPQTARKHEECRNLMLLFIWRALREKDCSFGFNQPMFDAIKNAGSRKRKAIVDLLQSSKFFKKAKSHSKNNKCIRWQLERSKIRRVARKNRVSRLVASECVPASKSAYQHNISKGETLTGLRSRFVLRWAFSDSRVCVSFAFDWMVDFHERFFDCQRLRFPDDSRVCACVVESLKAARLILPSLDALRSFLPSSFPPDRAAKYLDGWKSARAWPRAYLFRGEGRSRLYYPLVTQPKVMRREFLRLEYCGESCPIAEVDLHASYVVMLAAKLKDSESKRRLIEVLRKGDLYDFLTRELSAKGWTRETIKREFQRQCLLGKQHFGKGPIFGVLSEHFPSLAAYVIATRKNSSSSKFAHWLMKREARLMLDRIVPKVADQNIPVLLIHDGLIVPMPVAEQVKNICLEVSREALGFEPFFKITECHPKLDHAGIQRISGSEQGGSSNVQ